MKMYRKRTITQKFVEIYYTKIVLALKRIKEYKINFWMMTFFDITILITTLLFYFVLSSFVGDILNWTMLDFFLYFSIDLISWKALWQHNLRNLERRLLSGDFNDYRIRPINTYFLASIENVSGNNLISGVAMLIYVVLIILFNYTNFWFSMFLIIFSWFYFMAFANFLDSFAFFLKQNETIKEIPYRLNSVTKRFTPKLFENISVIELIMIMPAAVHGFFVIEIINGRFDLFYQFLPAIITSFMIFIIGTYLLWHYGLKKYEAFG